MTEPTGAYNVPLVGKFTLLVLALMELVKMPVFVPVSMRVRVSKSPALLVMVTLTVSTVAALVLRFKSLTRTLTRPLAR